MAEEAKKRKAALIQKYIRVFESDDGREVLKDLMSNSHLLTPTADEKDSMSFRNEGKRELMLYILHNLSYDVQSIIELIGETKAEKREKKAYENEDDEFDFLRD